MVKKLVNGVYGIDHGRQIIIYKCNIIINLFLAVAVLMMMKVLVKLENGLR